MKKKKLCLNFFMIAVVLGLFFFVFDFANTARVLGALGAFSGAFLSMVAVKSFNKS